MDSHVSAGRALVGDSLGFHLLIIMFSVGLPVLISAMELYGIITKRPRARAEARKWSRALVVLFIAGAVSGTIISMQFNLIWPKFMEFIGKVVGLGFVLEGTMFMIEAVFLSVYMLSWDRFKPFHHWLLSIPMVIGSTGSAVFITAVNAFMNSPAGFTLGADGQPTNIDTKAAIFNKAFWPEVTHSILAYYLATTLVILSLYAWKRLRSSKPFPKRYDRLMGGLAALALVFAVFVGLAGDRSGKYLAEHQPAKLAAAEAHYETGPNAPLVIGGVVKDGRVEGGLKMPSMLSFLATGKVDGVVTGLNDIPKEDHPPIWIHYFFDGMVGIGMLLIAAPVAYLAARKWKPALAKRRRVLWGVAALGPLAVIATELGWMLTEIGRQPYAVVGYLRTEDVVHPNPAIVKLGIVFPVLFVILLVLTILALRKQLAKPVPL